MKKQVNQNPELQWLSRIQSDVCGLPSTARLANIRYSVMRRLVIAALMSLLMPVAITQNASAQNSDGVTIQGTVVDRANSAVRDATVRLARPGVDSAEVTKTNEAGIFVFTAVRPGSYELSAEKIGLRSSLMSITASSQRDQKHLALILQSGDGSSPSVPAMDFADKPNFTVAGVTDWTAVGGHGSDSILRTSETLARDTVALKSVDGESGKARDMAAASAAPRNSELDLALACQQTGDLKHAREHLQKAIESSDNPEAWRLAGEVDEKLGDPLSAVHEFERAARLDPSERNYFEWGSELLLHRAVWQAEEVFKKGSEAYPKSARMLTALGSALFAGARYDEAALRLCDASNLNPADPEPYAFIGKIELVAPTPLPCVEPLLARFVEKQPENSLANYLYAMAIWKRQQQPADPHALQQVETLLARAVTIDPKCGDAYLQLGVISYSQKNVEKAIGFYKKAIEATPQLGEAHYRLGVAYDRAGEADRAAKEFQIHDEIEKRQADAIESQRREVKQFLVVLEGQPAVPPAH
jgi:tetratricopeptide (TPR) repeat protein